MFGTRHNRDFLVACLEKDCFAAGQATTAFIAEEFAEGEIADIQPTFTDSAVAAVLELALQHRELYDSSVIVAPELRDWCNASPLVSRKQYHHGEQIHDLSVTPLATARYQVSDADNTAVIEVFSMADSTAHVSIDGAQHIARYHLAEQGRLYLSIDGRAAEYRDMIRLDGVQDQAGGSGRIVAPMHGLLLEVRVAAGDTVEAGQTLAVLEAMKMHYEIVADATGEVAEVMAVAGTQVAADDVLIEISVAE